MLAREQLTVDESGSRCATRSRYDLHVVMVTAIVVAVVHTVPEQPGRVTDGMPIERRRLISPNGTALGVRRPIAHRLSASQSGQHDRRCGDQRKYLQDTHI